MVVYYIGVLNFVVVCFEESPSRPRVHQPRRAAALTRNAVYLRTLANLAHSRGAYLLLLDDGPRLPHNGVDCASTSTAARCAVVESVQQASRQDLLEVYQTLSDESNQTSFFPILGRFCKNGVCNALVPGTETVHTFDRDHWTFEGALFVAPFLACHLSAHCNVTAKSSNSSCCLNHAGFV